MKKIEKIVVASIIASLLSQGVVYGATQKNAKRASRTRSNSKRASATRTNIRGNLNTATNTFSKSGNVVSQQSPTTQLSDDTSITCGTPAAATNNFAKRKCTLVYLDALKLYCKNYPCTSKAKVEYNFNFGLPVVKNISMDINGTKCSGENLEKTCVAYQGEILSGVWDMYSEKTIRSRKNCNMARAKADAAQACFQYINSERNQSVGAVFNSSKKTKLDEGIEQYCGRDAIIKRYKDLSIDDWTDTDEQFLSGLALKDGSFTTTSGFQGRKEMSSTIASVFANVGDASWNIMGQVGKLAEIKLGDMKTKEYPREIVNMVNTFTTDITTHCGNEFAANMLSNNFELVDNRSALEKEIAKRGILKGTFDYVIDNTVGVFGGEKSAKNIKDKGVAGVIADKIQETKDKNCKANIYQKYYTTDKSSITNISTNCTKSTETTTQVKTAITHLDVALKEIEDSKKKYKDCRFDNNKTDMAAIIKEILLVLPKDSKITLSGDNISAYRKTVDELKTVKEFKCPKETVEEAKTEEPQQKPNPESTPNPVESTPRSVSYGYAYSPNPDGSDFDLNAALGAFTTSIDKFNDGLTGGINFDDVKDIVGSLIPQNPAER